MLSVAEVAAILGFSEAAAFHRSFKRWTGTTPKEFRTAAAQVVRVRDASVSGSV
jgi:AraC-like DNA-binding protein